MFKIILPKLNLKVEKWKWNKEFRVYVSTLGNFKDEYRKNIPVKIASKNGYVMIKTKYGYKYAHRLVMLTFKPIPNAEDLTVDHLDHNKRHNSLENLEWVTKEENEKRAKDDLVILPLKFKNTKIKMGKEIIFNNIDEAINYILCKNTDAKNKEYIKRKIYNAIKNEKKYFGEEWVYAE